MARKSTYLYRVKMWRGSSIGITEYCYARSKKDAVNGFKQIYANEKYDHFEAVCFAEADFELHPDYFAQMTAQEIRIIEQNGLASADSYSRRKDSAPIIPEDATFVPKEDLEKVLQQ